MKEVWDETFPNEDKKVKTKLQQRREVAKLQKEAELTQEEIDRLEEAIPDWKKGAVTVTDGKVQEEKQGLLKKLKKKVGKSIAGTEAAQQFYQSEEYKRLEKLRNEMQEFKHNLKEEIDSTQNPVVQGTRQVVDLVFMESSCARAVKEMQKYDPEFDIQQLHFEAEEIFKEFYCNFLAGNLDYIEKVCGK